MRPLVFISTLFTLCIYFTPLTVSGQRPSMPSSMPGLVPMGGVGSKNSLAGSNLRYNDGSFLNEKGGDIKGSPFLNDNWQPGSAFLKTREQYDSLLMKYDLVNDQLLIKIDENAYTFNDELREFRLTDSVAGKTLIFRNGFASVAGFGEKTFYRIAYDGKTKLLFKNKKVIVSGITSTPGVKEKTYEDQTSYYICTSSGIMKRIKKRNKTIADLFPDQSAVIKKYIEAEYGNTLNEEELVALLRFYDGL